MKRILPPDLFMLCAVAMIALRWIWPGPLWLPAPLHLLGLLPLAGGTALMLLAWDQFRRRQAMINTFGQPRHLVTDGWFRFSRNPMYLGFALMLLGIGLLLNGVTPLLCLALFVLVSERVYIPFEEAAMRAAFGAAFDAYCRRTRRWL